MIVLLSFQRPGSRGKTVAILQPYSIDSPGDASSQASHEQMQAYSHRAMSKIRDETIYDPSNPGLRLIVVIALHLTVPFSIAAEPCHLVRLKVVRSIRL